MWSNRLSDHHGGPRAGEIRCDTPAHKSREHIRNHPSGKATLSEPDIKVTRDLIRAEQILKIEVVDHVIVGNLEHRSLRSMGYFFP